MATRMLNLNNLTSSIGASLSNPLRSKKKYHFDVTLTLQELMNCTFVSGVLFAKLQLKDGGTFNGTSHRNEVDHHSVQWDEDFTFSCKMYANSSTMVLEPCFCKISIRKETKGGKSCTKLGYVKINLAEFAGQGTKHRKYLIHSYNENKHKPDNSLLKVKLYLRQTSGDIVFKPPETKSRVWESGEEDEGFQDDWLSAYSRSHTPRASNGSTMSTFSIATGGTWSSHGGSEGNLKSHDSLGEIGTKGEVAAEEEDRESGSEETVIEKAISQITTDTLKTTSSNNSGSWKTAETSSTVLKKVKVSSPNLSPCHSQSTESRTLSPVMSTRSQSTNNIPATSSLKQASVLSPSSPIILEETSRTDPLSTKGLPKRDSDPLHVMKLWNSQEEDETSKTNGNLLKVSPGSFNRRMSKGGASVQSSRVTAVPGGASKSHHRQASMSVFHQSPSPLTVGHHKRHNSFSTSINTDLPQSETLSLHSNRTRISTFSTLEQSRVDNASLINNLIAAHDLTPASDDDSESNLKLYIDKHGGGVAIAGHNLQDKHRFKEIDISSFSSEELYRSKKQQQKQSHRKSALHHTEHSRSSSEASSTDLSHAESRHSN